MSDISETATQALVERILEQHGGVATVHITVDGMPNSILVKEAISSRGVLEIIDGNKTLLVKETSIIAVEIQQPMDLSGVDLSFSPSPNYAG